MAGGYSRADLQAVGQAKFDDASILFEAGRSSNAYYLAGYAIECALKACIAHQIVAETLPDPRFVRQVFVHDFESLVGLAGLRRELQIRQDSDQLFQANWAVVREWRPDVRYESVDKSSAHLMLVAVGDPVHGVLSWIRAFW